MSKIMKVIFQSKKNALNSWIKIKYKQAENQKK